MQGFAPYWIRTSDLDISTLRVTSVALYQLS